jgi:hypothetical protein
VTDDAEDDGLESLRSVWLSMPDEDPPERGLADLMAAARVKATEMTKPSLWQRFVDTMRRPPVLALATVMILLGGVVLVGNRNKGTDAMDAQPTVSAPEAPGADRAPPSAEEAAQAAPETITAPPAPAAGSAAAPMAELAKDEPAPAPMKRPEPKTKSAPHTGATAAPPKADAKLERMRDADDAVMLSPLGETEQVEAGDKERPRSSPTPGGGASTGAALSTTGRTAAELHQQARNLVARGDCKAAATLTNRIAKQDPAYYKAKVVPDKAFDRCVLAQ